VSNHKNHRRGEERRTEHGPRYENPNPGAGCNATHVARARRKYRDRGRRAKRRREHQLDKHADELGDK
jgi:hypothetical protein